MHVNVPFLIYVPSWKLQLRGDEQCLLMSSQDEYEVAINHAEGDKDLDCAFDGTPLSTIPLTMSKKIG